MLNYGDMDESVQNFKERLKVTINSVCQASSFRFHVKQTNSQSKSIIFVLMETFGVYQDGRMKKIIVVILTAPKVALKTEAFVISQTFVHVR